MTDLSIDIQVITDIAQEAGDKILTIYEQDFEVEYKDDHSPLTIADKESNNCIVSKLKNIYPHIPIISEESKLLPYSERKNWEQFWLVDPLDGTKEFIKKNGEFTVNIALIEKGVPTVGVVYVPVQDKMYYAQQGDGAYLNGNKIQTVQPSYDLIKVIGSRSHKSEELTNYLKELAETYKQVEFIAAGSSLKICKIAEGNAHIYPRFGPTMEWDIAAGHAIVLEAGGNLKQVNGERIQYNKENLRNPFFIVRS